MLPTAIGLVMWAVTFPFAGFHDFIFSICAWEIRKQDVQLYASAVML
jgi:hypothetical protein